MRGVRCGPYSVVDIEALRVAFGDAAWLRSPCPHLGPPVGALAWDRLEAHHTEDEYFPVLDLQALDPPLADLVVELAVVCRGAFVDTRSGRWRPSVHLARRTLRSCLGKFGLDDGDTQLDRHEGRYRGELYATFVAAARRAGVEPAIHTLEYTSHNPFRWHGSVQDLDRLEAALVDVWLLDLDLANDPVLFSLPDVDAPP